MRLTVVKEEFAPDAVPVPLVRLIQAATHAPSALDFGHFAAGADGVTRGAFTPVITGAGYGTATGPVAGAAFQPQVITPATGSPTSTTASGHREWDEPRALGERPGPHHAELRRADGGLEQLAAIPGAQRPHQHWSATAPEGTFSDQ
ncbi:hypothetical protein ACN28S_21610 [Cystobacter fuscus]